MKALLVLAIIGSVYFAVKIFSEVKQTSLLGESATPATISFSGHGEVTGVPDIASIYFTISKDSKTGEAAQAAVAVVEKQALDFLKSKGVAEKDIKTNNVSLYPNYEYKQAVYPMPVPMGEGTAGTVSPSYPSCPGSRRVLTDYTASENIIVKIRNVDDAGVIIQGLGEVGVSDLNGPNYEIDDMDALQAQARKKAIDDAKQKAEILAKDLGVRLVKITSFYESGGGPIYYAEVMMKDSTGGTSTPAVLPKGENTISSDVTITYEIR